MRTSAALVVLCGGQGRRLGGAVKPLLAYPDGTTLLGRILTELAPAFAEVWLSVTAETALPLAAAFPGVAQVRDPGRGPACALGVAAAVVAVPWIVLVGGDQPGLSLDAVRTLEAAARQSRAAATVPTVGGRRCPLPGFYAREALPLAGLEDASLQAILDRLGAHEVVGMSPHVVASVNTPADAAAVGLVNGVPRPEHPQR